MSGRVAREARRARVEDVGRLVHDDHAAYGITVRQTRGGRVATTWEAHPDPVIARVQLLALRRLLDELERGQVYTLRLSGWSWDEVADLWEMSRAGVQKRFDGVDDDLRQDLADARAARAGVSVGVPAQRPARA